MKIFFPIGAFYPSQIGGPCNTLYWHTSELKKYAIDIDIVTTTVGIKKGLVKSNIFYKNECGTIFYGEGDDKKILTLYTALKRVRTSDIIHLNSLFTFISIVVFFYSKIFFNDKKVIWSIRGELSENALKYSSWKKNIIMFLYKKCYKKIVFHSTSDQESKDIYSNFKNSKVIQIPNLIRPTERNFNIEYNKNLLYIGRIHPIKSIHKIIEGLSLSEIFLKSESKLFLVGIPEKRHNDYFESLKKLIIEKKLENKVVFKGHLIGNEKELIYAQAYATLLLSETENFGNVVVESLNHGTPVITSKGTPWSILENFNCGYHISNEPSSVAKAIDKILTMNDSKYKKMRINSIKLVEDEFNVQNQIFRWIKQYNDMMVSE